MPGQELSLFRFAIWLVHLLRERSIFPQRCVPSIATTAFFWLYFGRSTQCIAQRSITFPVARIVWLSFLPPTLGWLLFLRARDVWLHLHGKLDILRLSAGISAFSLYFLVRWLAFGLSLFGVAHLLWFEKGIVASSPAAGSYLVRRP